MRSDSEIQQDVLRELRQDPRVEPRHLGVEVEFGIVTLTGTVATCAQAAAAQQVASRVPGVREVTNWLHVVVPEHRLRSDRDIACALNTMLEWDAEVPHDRLQATVVGGIVTLDGEVDHEYQRDVAERAVRHLAGVRGVVNRIAVHTPMPHGIQRDLAPPLEWQPAQPTIPDLARPLHH